MITILLVTAGVLMLVGTMYACLVVGSRMDDQLADFNQWEMEGPEENDRDKEDKG